MLRTRGLSIKNLDEGRRGTIRRLINRLHHERGISLGDIAKLIGNKTSGYTSWLCKKLEINVRPFEESRLKAIKEKRRKYERRPFDGTDQDKAYLLGLRHGDLSVSRPWRGVIRVSTSSTHPALAELFTKLFNHYGHVYQLPRYKEDMQTYEWNLQVILDDSFEFMFEDFTQTASWVQQDRSTLLEYLSGLLDADGAIITTRDQDGKVSLFLDYYNSNKSILEWVKGEIKKLGYFCSIRRNKKRGARTRKYGIIHRTDYWQFSTYGMNNIQGLIAKLHPRHAEKVRRQAIALSVSKGQDYSLVQKQIEALRAEIRQGVQDYIRKAELQHKRTHPI